MDKPYRIKAQVSIFARDPRKANTQVFSIVDETGCNAINHSQFEPDVAENIADAMNDAFYRGRETNVE